MCRVNDYPDDAPTNQPRPHARTKLGDLQASAQRTVDGLAVLDKCIPWKLVNDEDEAALYDLFNSLEDDQ